MPFTLIDFLSLSCFAALWINRVQSRKKLSEIQDTKRKIEAIKEYHPSTLKKAIKNLENKEIFVEGIVDCPKPIILLKSNGEKLELVRFHVFSFLGENYLLDYILEANKDIKNKHSQVSKEAVEFKLIDYFHKTDYITVEKPRNSEFLTQEIDALEFLELRKNYTSHSLWKIFKIAENLKYLGIKNGSYLTIHGIPRIRRGSIFIEPTNILKSKGHLLNKLADEVDVEESKIKANNILTTSLFCMYCYYRIFN